MSEYIPERAMFVCAHPDDLEFGVAGTAAKWANNGCEVTYVILTDGNAGSHDKEMTRERIAEIRREEQREAAKICGVQNCIFLGYDDGLLQPTLELRKKLVRLIRQYRPNVVAAMDPTNYFPSDGYINHPDHRAAGVATIEAVFPAAEMGLLYPDLAEEGLEGHKPNYVYLFFTQEEQINLYVDISDYLETKISSLKAHKSQMEEWDPTERITSWAAQIGEKVGFSYAERYRRITQKEPDANPKKEEGAGEA